MNRSGKKLAIALLLLASSVSGQAQVKVIVDLNTGSEATAAFKFKHVPSPVKADVAAKAKLSLVVGDRDGNGGELTALNDGALPVEADQPAANFFFAAGSDGGRIQISFDHAIEVAQVNSYSWHPGARGPQFYNLFASDGTDPKFNPEPNEHTDPATCGWKLVTTVDTRPEKGSGGGQYGVSITDAGGSLGKVRYLLFDVVPTESEDPFGNTFFSEIDVIEKK